eukprot:CAMPEP_0176009094 /NCGR_PEP_ID=MMETSP0120_2-20121206/4077_1 /TAXON_ID=160619 /ORGANISM="Kryptoperidinium foliaceum, Strain CCMP 1326" /LENGTH=219 /DNA_ID=CAMNT_0017341887 /DNA_START=68 /DNA_END=727 /DNA_ORIENTATION=-
MGCCASQSAAQQGVEHIVAAKGLAISATVVPRLRTVMGCCASQSAAQQGVEHIVAAKGSATKRQAPAMDPLLVDGRTGRNGARVADERDEGGATASRHREVGLSSEPLEERSPPASGLAAPRAPPPHHGSAAGDERSDRDEAEEDPPRLVTIPEPPAVTAAALRRVGGGDPKAPALLLAAELEKKRWDERRETPDAELLTTVDDERVHLRDLDGFFEKF